MARRRSGSTVAALTAEAGVSRQLVTNVTSAFGPFPRGPVEDPALVDEWVAARRRHRRSVPVIALASCAADHRVRAATAPFGPLPPPRHGPGGLIGVEGVADLLGLAGPTVLRWREAGFLPTAQVASAG